MHLTRYSIAAAILSVLPVAAFAQCPPRPATGSLVKNPYTVKSQNGTLTADLALGQSVDDQGYTHYCYQYQSPGGIVEAPTLRVNPGDTLQLNVSDVIQDQDASKMNMHHAASGTVCGDGGTATVSSTNVHFHGMPIPPVCHQDDVINTLIQPGTGPFNFNIQIPADNPPGLYWYHPHVHGFTEFQVNGGAAGALIVNGMEKVRPEVKGLKERLFVVRQQYLVPWIPGPYQLSVNYQVTLFSHGGAPFVNMKPGEREFWRVANATLQDFLPLQVFINGKPEKLELIARDGYPLAKTRNVDSILVPPAGRVEFIVTAPPDGGIGQFVTGPYDTGPTGNPDTSMLLAFMYPVAGDVAGDPDALQPLSSNENSHTPAPKIKWSDLENVKVTAERKLYFSEEFGGTNGPIQFYITVDGQKQQVFDPNEKPVIKTKVGAVEDWTIENRALETHAFHMHQIHFKVLEVDGQKVNGDLLDTIEIPYWSGKGPYHSVKVRMDFRDPNIAGTFLFHCHILLHEDLGMMHKIQVDP